MKKIIFSLIVPIFLSSFLLAEESEEKIPDRYQSYLKMVRIYPDTLGPLGHHQKKEIQVITDPVLMAKIEKETNRTVGLIAEDKYWIWLNDAVQFPNGKYGVYGRMMWRSSLTGYTGAAVLIVSKDGKISLNCNYRHATRSWEMELPRGTRNPAENIYDTARREVKEETGMGIEDLQMLGVMTPDTGVSNMQVPVFFAKVSSIGDAEQEDSESIVSADFYKISDIKQGLIDGYLTVEVDGEKRKVNFRDPFFSYAFLQAEIRGLLPIN